MPDLRDSFIDVVIRISRQPSLEFCRDYLERNGVRPFVCVHRDGVFLGMLRWPDQHCPAQVDDAVFTALEELETADNDPKKFLPA